MPRILQNPPWHRTGFDLPAMGGAAGPRMGDETHGTDERKGARERIARLVRRVEILHRRRRELRKAEIEIEHKLDQTIIDLVRAVAEQKAIGCTISPALLPGGNSSRHEIAHAFRMLAESGANTLEIKPRLDGAFDIRIDGGRWFVLGEESAELLRILAADRGPGGGEFVGWKSSHEIADSIKEKLGKHPSRGAINQAIHRLRKELTARGHVNPQLLQTHRSLGRRFALRRCGTGIDQSDA